MSLAIVRRFHPNDVTFRPGLLGLLRRGDIRIVVDGIEVPEWRWREILSISDVADELPRLKIRITEQGIHKMG